MKSIDQKQKNACKNRRLIVLFGGPDGLEPATSGVTGRHSNQLNYRSTITLLPWWVVQD